MTDELPTLQEEINRKTYEAFAFIARKHDQGEWSPAQARAALDALWLGVSGLVEKDLFELFQSMDAELPQEVAVITHIFIGSPNHVVIVRRKVGGEKFLVISNVSMKTLEPCTWSVEHYDYKDKVLPAVECHKGIQEMQDKLIRLGYRQI